MNDIVLVEVEQNGKSIKLVKINKSYKIVDNTRNEYSNVRFIKDKDALVKLNEQLETI